ncbi:hypothetical protein SAMN00790413_02059 [Deinococcus hopiensis KR-140]|uniref:Uncharacterized protein n=1 Tax=Deinococcus hopiensis KR-140 TaxID=695939 RepID=A0A1W1VJS6_9DEIO|nr:hypothetical protein SAMN00790413_02059 [Deinococcus hopiensis KR-140]
MGGFFLLLRWPVPAASRVERRRIPDMPVVGGSILAMTLLLAPAPALRPLALRTLPLRHRFSCLLRLG